VFVTYLKIGDCTNKVHLVWHLVWQLDNNNDRINSEKQLYYTPNAHDWTNSCKLTWFSMWLTVPFIDNMLVPSCPTLSQGWVNLIRILIKVWFFSFFIGIFTWLEQGLKNRWADASILNKYASNWCILG